MAAYVYSAAGPGESTTDLAWDGQASIYELGIELAERHRTRRVRHDRRRATDERERAVELVPGQGLIRPEVCD